jgi:hypothetical protein
MLWKDGCLHVRIARVLSGGTVRRFVWSLSHFPKNRFAILPSDWGKSMSAKAGLIGTAFGTAAGTIAWIVNLDEVLWPQHPRWALFLIAFAFGIVTGLITDRDIRRLGS